MPESPKPALEAKRPKQGRSPAYPAFPLKDAIANAKALYDKQGKYPAPMALAFDAWGYSAKSSSGRDARAALKYFGLITLEGDGETGKVKLTDDALRILLDEREDQTEKKAIIRRLALTPAVHKKLLEQFPDGIKSDATAEHFLVFEQGYNKSAAGEVVAEFNATADFAELFKPANVLVKADQKQEAEPESETNVEVGDLVNVERAGTLVFPTPVRVREIKDHDGQLWVWTDGASSWTEMETVELVSKGEPVGKLPPPPPALSFAETPPAKGTRKEVFALDEGDVVVTYPESLSANSFEDLEAYLKVFLRKAKRRSETEGAGAETGNG